LTLISFLCDALTAWCLHCATRAAAGQLAFDAAMPAVRVAVLEGLQLLVDNQHAQPVLSVSGSNAVAVHPCSCFSML
jgi:hypothetical protein